MSAMHPPMRSQACAFLLLFCVLDFVPRRTAAQQKESWGQIPSSWATRCPKTNVQIFSLEREPFSYRDANNNKVGLTLEFVDSLLAKALPGTTPSVSFLDAGMGNDDMFSLIVNRTTLATGEVQGQASKDCDFTTQCNLCIGAAAISITPVPVFYSVLFVETIFRIPTLTDSMLMLKKYPSFGLQEREQFLDFLPSYFLSSLQVCGCISCFQDVIRKR